MIEQQRRVCRVAEGVVAELDAGLERGELFLGALHGRAAPSAAEAARDARLLPTSISAARPASRASGATRRCSTSPACSRRGSSAASLAYWCSLVMLRIVPLRERITSEWVVAVKCAYRTPRISSPSVIPVATKKQSSPVTSSSVDSTALEVVAGVDRALLLLVVGRPELVPGSRRPAPSSRTR